MTCGFAPHVKDTALMAAAYRALESESPGGRVRGPFAARYSLSYRDLEEIMAERGLQESGRISNRAVDSGHAAQPEEAAKPKSASSARDTRKA